VRFTNRNNLPQPIVDAVTNDRYTKGPSTFSVTELISPPRIRILKKKHWDSITEDVSDRIFSLLGQLMHQLLERANRTGIAERRYYLDILGETVSGGMDAIYDDSRKLIQDYKFVSYYQVRDGLKFEFEAQLNCYAYILKHGYYYDPEDTKFTTKLVDRVEIAHLQDVFILRDWRKAQAGRDGMPEEQVVHMNVPLWPEEKTLAFLTERITAHTRAERVLPDCTFEERWATSDKWAVMPKPNAPRSLRNYDAREDAEAHAARVKGAFVEARPGQQKRCESYCLVRDFCSQYKNLTAKEAKDGSS
jgi:PD-(D/E)XK nuclease superfamily